MGMPPHTLKMLHPGRGAARKLRRLPGGNESFADSSSFPHLISLRESASSAVRFRGDARLFSESRGKLQFVRRQDPLLNQCFDGVAEMLGREIPPLERIAFALGRLDGMDSAFVFFIQEHAGPVRQHPDSQPPAVLAQDGIGGDEIFLGEPQKLSDPRDFSVRDLDLPFPAATGAAANTGDDDF